MKIKTPNPYEKDQATYFDKSDDRGIRCIGAALTLDKDTHIIICAPDAVVLKSAWKKLTTIQLDLKKAPILLYRYEHEVEEFKKELRDLKTTVSTVKHEPDAEPWFWYYRRRGNKCFIESHTEKDTDIILGDAIDCTIDECKLLMRKKQIPRAVINEVDIDTSTDDLIPF